MSEQRLVAGPPFKAVGGKTQLLEKLSVHLPPTFRRYHEPFAGGASLFFHLASTIDVTQFVDLYGVWANLNDANKRLASVYLALQNNPAEVIDVLKKYAGRYAVEREKFYYEARAYEWSTMMLSEQAAWFLFVNRTGYNGMYRENADGGFNIPHGKWKGDKLPRIVFEEELHAVADVLRFVRVTSLDFEEAVADADVGDLVYFDPPYVPLSATSDFTQYTAQGFVAQDQVRLRDCAVRLKERGVHVILSNSSAPFVHHLYAGPCFTIHEVDARRSINSKVTKRGPVKEVIIT